MGNYSATVVKIDNLRPHINADRLICSQIFCNNVIVGKDTQIGDIMLYFPLESQIGEEFAAANDLIRRKDEAGKSAGGMFDINRRVRAQTFRGEKSMGFAIPIDSLDKTFKYLGKELPEVKVGQEFEELGGVQISQKYVSPCQYRGSTPKGKKGKKPEESRLIDGQFYFHFDTSQLTKNLHNISKNSLISITWKLHGTSGIASKVMVKKNLKWYEKIIKRIGVNIVDKEYDCVYSSRKVIKNSKLKKYNHFYGMDIWTEVGEKLKDKLRAGETVYYEICGFTPKGKSIQKGYDYKCKQTEHKVYIYRITLTNVDGFVTELPWNQVKYRSIELGFETVPDIYYGYAKHFLDNEFEDDRDFQQYFYNYLAKNYVYDQDSQFCNNKVPEEGVVVRVEYGDGIKCYKLKNWHFYEYETKSLDKGEVDIETEEGENHEN